MIVVDVLATVIVVLSLSLLVGLLVGRFIRVGRGPEPPPKPPSG